MNNQSLHGSMPMGLGMALMRNEKALTKFAALSDAERQRLIDGAHQINSKQQMHAYVEHFAQES